MGCSESRTIERIKQNERKTMEFDENETDFTLYEAIKDEDIQCLAEIFESEIGVDYKIKSFFNRTALHVACVLGSAKVVEFLLSLGASCRTEDSYGITAIFLAEVKGHTKCVQLIKSSTSDYIDLESTIRDKSGSLDNGKTNSNRRFSLQ